MVFYNKVVKTFIIFILMFRVSYSQFSDARDFLNSPLGQNDINFEYNYISGGYSVLPDVNAVEGNAFESLYSLTYTRNFSLGGKSASVETTLGYGHINSSGEAFYLQSSTDTIAVDANSATGGITDLSFVFTANIIGAPAMNLKKFNNTNTNNSLLSGRLFLSTPIGDYKKHQIMNISTNNWIFVPEIAFSKPFGDNFILDIYGNVTFFTNNTEFLDSNIFAENPVYGIDLHPSYTIIPSLDLWISFDGMIRFYDESSVNGVDQDNAYKFLMIGSTIEVSLSDEQSISLQYLNNLFLGTDTPNNWQIFASYSYSFF